ncbi:hypothetical protein ACFQJ7_15375 [Halovenus rubra]|uniref:Uncharacterized protein n=2 Tax=Halovenus rubra TaxID=869890 RepID=A0ABD5X8B1_9EURY|nr:hypothetical protein [Halovenus rubra]
MSERAQTVNDYLLGITIFLVSIILVFGYFPNVFMPFEEEVGNDESVMAENIAAELVENSSVAEAERTVEFAALNRSMDSLANDATQVGIPDWLRWNATVRNGTGMVVESASERLQNGSVWRDKTAATTIRFVRIEQPGVCDDGCRLIVRVW